MPLDWSPLWLSLRYAAMATLFALLPAIPLAWLLQRHRFPGCHFVDAAANLPLVMPPAVLVYYLIAAQGRWPLVFTWRAAVALSAIYTLPLLLLGVRAGLAAADDSFENAARGLGAGEWRTFWRITMPLCWRATLAAVLAGFVRALADFGATAIIAAGAGAIWFLPIAAVAWAALYAGSRLSRARVWA